MKTIVNKNSRFSLTITKIITKQAKTHGTKTNNNYTVNNKKRDILFLTVTLANLDRFL